MAYIDRELMLEKVREKATTKFDWSEQIDVDDFEKVIKEIPTADVAEVKHGEWIFDFTLDGSNFYWCSECGRQEVLLSKESTEEYFPYCHCGAKMDGGKHDKT